MEATIEEWLEMIKVDGGVCTELEARLYIQRLKEEHNTVTAGVTQLVQARMPIVFCSDKCQPEYFILVPGTRKP